MKQEEDDLTQEIRALVVFEAKQEIIKLIIKIEIAKLPQGDLWADGVNAGLDLAKRILVKGTSAS